MIGRQRESDKKREREREREREGERERETDTECKGSLKNVSIFGGRQWSELRVTGNTSQEKD